VLAGCVVLAASGAHGQSLDRFPPSQRERVRHEAQASLELLSDWFGRSPLQQPDLGGVPVRWLTFERDQSLERAVIAAVTRQYWSQSLGRDALTPFEESVVVYTATRAIHQRLQGSNFAVVRFFGGILPLPLRAVLLSPQGAHPRPRVWQIDELPAAAGVMRTVRSLQTIERYAGWPATAQALAAMRSASAPRLDVETLTAALSSIRGTDMQPVVAECFRADAVFDYAIAEVSAPAAHTTPIETTVSIVRAGSGVFEAGTEADPERTMPVLVRFADGSERRDWFEGRAERTTLVYTTNSRLVLAAIDPEVMLLLDRDRANNTFTTATALRPLGVRLALHWVSWLQQMMLTYSAIV
jgi:hypothetical protein